MMAAGGNPNRRILRLGLALAALCLATLFGCAVGPDYKRPETKVPDNWNGQEVLQAGAPGWATLRAAARRKTRDGIVRPKGADHQWGKDPLK